MFHDDKDGTESWRWRRRFGRVQLGLFVYRHHPLNTRAPQLPDRWVVHPTFVYDRKRL